MKIQIIIKIHELLVVGKTGTPTEFAEKLSLSVRSLYAYLQYMKTELKAPIVYNAYNRNYCYDGKCGLNFKG